MLAFSARLGSAFIDCISTRRTCSHVSTLNSTQGVGKDTSKGWFQQLRAPPTVDAHIFSVMFNFSFGVLFRMDLICPSASRDIPILDDQPVICLSATALTPLLTPRIPFVRSIWKNVSIVPGTREPEVATLFLVTSTVFIQVVMPRNESVTRVLQKVAAVNYPLSNMLVPRLLQHRPELHTGLGQHSGISSTTVLPQSSSGSRWRLL